MIYYLPIENFPCKPIYLLSGYNSDLILDAISCIKIKFKVVKKYFFNNLNNFLEFMQQNYLDLFNFDFFSNALVNISIEITLDDRAIKPEKLVELTNLCDNLTKNPNLVLIFITESTKNLEKTKIFKYINLNGVILISKNLSKNNFKQWALHQFKLANLNITAAALDKFLENHHNNLLAAKQLIEKIQLRYTWLGSTEAKPKQNQLIDLSQLLENLEIDQAKYSLFDLQDAMMVIQNHQVILNVIHNLKLQLIEPSLVLWSIIQVLQKLSNRLNLDDNFGQAMGLLWQKAAEIDLVIKQANLWPQTGNNKLRSNNIPAYSKVNASVSSVPECWNLILDLCLDISNIT